MNGHGHGDGDGALPQPEGDRDLDSVPRQGGWAKATGGAAIAQARTVLVRVFQYQRLIGLATRSQSQTG
jgi:hypothetical protein